VAEFFISYTSSDREWAFWIGQELEKLGHKPRIHEWEISAGGSIPAWMEQCHHSADHVLCVISKLYLGKPYSSWGAGSRAMGGCGWATEFRSACEDRGLRIKNVGYYPG
jgi:hypothetical protein